MLGAKKFAAVALGFASAISASAQEAGVSQRAHELLHVGPLPITNTMITSWVVAVVVVLVIRLAVGRRPTLRPGRGQVVVETLVQGVLDLTSPIVGKKVERPTFPLLVGLFTFILLQNWAGLFPGVGTVMMWDPATRHWEDFVRPGNTDLNLTFALSLVAFIAWLYFILRYAGPAAVIRDLFGNKAEKGDMPIALYLFLYLLFFLVGVVEILSIMFRPVSLSFRLFGNMFGGENLMHSMSELTPWARWGLPIPFMFLEMLIGFIQALVFTLLVSVYIGLICNHDGGHDEAAAHH